MSHMEEEPVSVHIRSVDRHSRYRLYFSLFLQVSHIRSSGSKNPELYL
jgi:hypothetical protein